MPPYVLYGGKYIDQVSLAPFLGRFIKQIKRVAAFGILVIRRPVIHTLTWIVPAYVLYGAKYIDLVSPGPFSGLDGNSTEAHRRSSQCCRSGCGCWTPTGGGCAKATRHRRSEAARRWQHCASMCRTTWWRTGSPTPSRRASPASYYNLISLIDLGHAPIRVVWC